MTAERFRELRRLFDAALRQPPHRRAAWLAAACPDAELSAQVEALLEADAVTGTGLPLSGWLPGPAEALAGVFAGRRIGDYTLTREIGRGGMGVVYLAARVDRLFSRPVAVKIVRADAVDPDHVRRFQQEREIVARLDHPHIARLLDGGTTDDGLHYSVIEYVDGQRIDAFCAAGRLGIPERLALLQTVCAAVQYAHQHLVVHRDLKPSNILVTADGQVKLLDFGIAKLLDSTAEDTVNAAGRLMTMTYASPEQLRGERVSTQSDVYSLGVVLYELLAGRRPHGAATAFDVARAVCEDDPVPPSECAVASQPGARLDAELDAIVLMALRKEPGRRYASVEAFGEDLRRYRAGLPVVAQPDAVSYRARKFVQRHRTGVGLSAAALVLLAAFALTAAWQARAASEARARAEQETAEAVLQSRRAEEQSRIAEAYRRDAEREAAAARQQLAIAEQQRAEAESRRQEAAVERGRAEQRARDVRVISAAMLDLNAAIPEATVATEAARRAADAVREGLLRLGVDSPRDATLQRDVANAQQIVERYNASRASLTPGTPDGWWFDARQDEFETGLDRSDSAGAVAYIIGSARAQGMAILEQVVLGDQYAGKRLRVTADLKSVGVERRASLIARAMFDTTAITETPGLRFRGTNDWDRFTLVFDVPADILGISFGFTLEGPGVVWADNFSLEVVDQTVELTTPPQARPRLLDFEH